MPVVPLHHSLLRHPHLLADINTQEAEATAGTSRRGIAVEERNTMARRAD